jgi:hypothetical protein
MGSMRLFGETSRGWNAVLLVLVLWQIAPMV